MVFHLRIVYMYYIQFSVEDEQSQWGKLTYGFYRASDITHIYSLSRHILELNGLKQ